MNQEFTSNPTFLQESQIRDVKFGKNVKVIEPVNMFECTIGDNCLVGAFVEIQKNVVIGNGSRIQSHSFICQNVVIGENCFMAHGVMFADDMFQSGRPSYHDMSKWKKITIGKNVSLGTNATIMASICDNVVIGAGAVVTRDITEPGIYAGNPARFFRAIPKKDIPQPASLKTDL